MSYLMKRAAKILLLFGTISFAALFIASPLLHNHRPDLKDHYNCPAYILNITLVSFTFAFFIVFQAKFPKPRIKPIPNRITNLPHYIKLNLTNKSPPNK
ncbi:hypothetical protein BMS3Abin04_00958 [bacterium BMS3Abin04]|nr:hypothetical protein BMS3Abin04_00958 [bacterium BMS3Abin04]